MVHNVKCVYCKEVFDTNKSDWVKPRSNRYAHKECAIANGLDIESLPEDRKSSDKPVEEKIKKITIKEPPAPAPVILTKEEQDHQDLNQYIVQLFNLPFVTARIQKQINSYRQLYNYTYSGILKSLIWFYDITKHSTEKANQGIGIVPYIYDDACKYYYNLYLAEKANSDKDIKSFIPIEKEILIPSPRSEKKQPKLFNLEEDTN